MTNFFAKDATEKNLCLNALNVTIMFLRYVIIFSIFGVRGLTKRIFHLQSKHSLFRISSYSRIVFKHWKNYGTKIASHASCARKTFQSQKLDTTNTREKLIANLATPSMPYPNAKVAPNQLQIEPSKPWEDNGISNVQFVR